MAKAAIGYDPDYAIPPGWIVGERLEAQGMSQAEFARRCGRSPKLISEIVSGKAPLEPGTALQFEKVLGLDASIWLGIESRYQLHRARQAEKQRAAFSVEWARAFPVRELVERGFFRNPDSDIDAVSQLLAFFRVGSIDAWTARYSRANVAYRHSRSFKSNEQALTTWLRLGEIDAEGQACAEFDKSRFRHAAQAIRGLTIEPPDVALKSAAALCNQAGVALALVPPLPGTALSGAAWWLSPRKAVIQLTARHKSDDHLWFSFFHEAAHILLHSKREVFVDEANGSSEDLEMEADDWASNMLVPARAFAKFASTSPRSERAIKEFAAEQGVAPGIIVGMLQHKEFLPWSHLNGLKRRVDWDLG